MNSGPHHFSIFSMPADKLHGVDYFKPKLIQVIFPAGELVIHPVVMQTGNLSADIDLLHN